MAAGPSISFVSNSGLRPGQLIGLLAHHAQAVPNPKARGHGRDQQREDHRRAEDKAGDAVSAEGRFAQMLLQPRSKPAINRFRDESLRCEQQSDNHANDQHVGRAESPPNNGGSRRF
jgi:hypothetical protein